MASTGRKQFSRTTDIRRSLKVPTFAQIGKNMLNVRKSKLSLRNSLVAKKISEENERRNNANTRITEFERLRRKFNRNAVISKSFPVKEGEYKYPGRGLDKVPNPKYKTQSMMYGSLMPTNMEIPSKYYPTDNSFTDRFIGGMYSYGGLNTAYSYSKSHRYNDGDL
jgi:hypothetical protein